MHDCAVNRKNWNNRMWMEGSDPSKARVSMRIDDGRRIFPHLRRLRCSLDADWRSVTWVRPRR